MVSLGNLGGMETAVSDASADGSIAVGSAENAEGDMVPFLWDNVNGIRDLTEVLIADHDLESSLAGWDNMEATEISSDGLTIVGNGSFEDSDRIWIARIDSAVVPEPSSLILLGIALACLFGNARLRV